MAEVIDTGGGQRLKALFDKIRSELPKTLQSIAAVMAAEASARAPSPEQEYEIMSVGDGNPEGITRVPPMPLSEGDSDGDGKRLRFYKPQQMYLQNVIIDSYVCDGLMIGVGDISKLNAASVYEWRNVTGDTYSTNFPFWEAWEGGIDGSFFISPKHYNGRHIPTVKPGVGRENQRYFLYKRLPALHMYGGINVDKYVQRILIPAIQSIAKQS